MEVNIIYDLLLKFLLLKTITLCKLLVLSFPEGSVVTISGLQAELKEQTERNFVFPKQMPFKAAVSAQHCWLTSSRDGHLDIRASAGQPLGYWTARDPAGPWCSDPCHGNQPSASYTSYFNPLWRELPLNLGIIFVHLLPLGVLCLETLQLLRRRTEPSSARRWGRELPRNPALGCAYLVCRPSALSLSNRSSQLGLLIWGIILEKRIRVNIQPAFFFSSAFLHLNGKVKTCCPQN